MKRPISAAILSFFAFVSFAGAGDAPPAALLHLERDVSLKIAHARDGNYSRPDDLKRLSDAQAADFEGERHLQAGDYNKAEAAFLKAKLLLHDLGI